jgi:hypothetical protein
MILMMLALLSQAGPAHKSRGGVPNSAKYPPGSHFPNFLLSIFHVFVHFLRFVLSIFQNLFRSSMFQSHVLDWAMLSLFGAPDSYFPPTFFDLTTVIEQQDKNGDLAEHFEPVPIDTRLAAFF